MPRRIDIELTSALGDGSWTWRAAGAKQPRGVLDGDILPAGSSVGDELKVEVEQEIDGITVLSVVQGRGKSSRDDLLELLPVERDFQPVLETRAKRERGERGPRRDGDRRPRRDRDDRGGRGGRGDDRGREGDRGRRGDRKRDRGESDQRSERRPRRGPSFTPPPEVPQRPKPKRLKPGKAHRSAILNELPAEQRAIAELALQGMSAVRARLKEENQKAVAEGRPAMPEATVLKMAEELLPRLRVAEWLDRAEAAERQMEHLDLRDLRSVVAAAGDPMVARDESTRELAEQLQAALATKQEQELHLWFGDVDAALAVGRVIRALRLSSQPPKAGVPFPTDIAQRLVDSTNAALAPMDGPDRWSAILEAAAFSPIHALVQPARRPDAVSDELLATVKRLAPALPLVAALFEIEVDPDAPMPKPQRPGPRQRKGKPDESRRERGPKPKRIPAPPSDRMPASERSHDGDDTATETATAAARPDVAAPETATDTETATAAIRSATDDSTGEPTTDDTAPEATPDDVVAGSATDDGGADAAASELAPDAAEPATDAAASETAPEPAEPATDAAASETAPDAAEPATDAAASETAPEPATAGSAADESTGESDADTADDRAAESAPEAAEPATDGTGTGTATTAAEPAVDDTGTETAAGSDEPATDDTASEPATAGRGSGDGADSPSVTGSDDDARS